MYNLNINLAKFDKYSKVITILLTIIIIPQLTFGQAYLGYATTRVNLREGPGTTYDIIAQIPTGEQVFVISKNPTNSFLNVILIRTATEGWIHKKYIKIKSAIPRNSERLFTPQALISSRNPKVEIFNNTSLTLTLKLNYTNYLFKPKEKRTLILNPGNYEYRALAPGVIPYYGEDILEENYKYSWEFYIVRMRQP